MLQVLATRLEVHSPEEDERILADHAALLFSAISLLMLAYTNRFLALASLIRSLHTRYQDSHEPLLREQIHALRLRVGLIRSRQSLGISSLFCCMTWMLALFLGWPQVGKAAFGLGLVLMMSSLALSLREIQLSVNALNLVLHDLDEGGKNFVVALDEGVGSG